MASSQRKKFIVIGLAALLIIGISVFIYLKSNQPKEKKYAHIEQVEDDNSVEVIIQENGGLKSDNIDKKKKAVKKKKKKRKRKYHKRKVKNKKTGKVETVMVEVDESAEMKKAFDENSEENKDVASISFKNKSSGRDLKDDEIRAKTNTIKSAVISCFEKEYSRTNYLPSRLAISYTIRQNGKLYNITIQHPKYKKKKGKLNYCVVKAFRRISFQPFSGGTKVGAMPLEFEID